MFRNKLLDLIQVAFLSLVLSASGNVDTVIGRTSDTISLVGTTDRIIVFTIPSSGTQITFSLATNASPTAPYVTAALLTNATDVVWTGPAGTTNSKTPAADFFSPNGDYTLTVSDWGKVTALSFGQASARNFLTALDPTNAFALMTATNINFLNFANNSVSKYSDGMSLWLLPSNIVSIGYAWNANRAITNGFPSVNHCSGITTANYAWADCSSYTGVFPEVNLLTNCITVEGAWENAKSSKGPFPAISNLTKLTKIGEAWFNGYSNVYPLPYINNLTNVTTLEYCWWYNFSLVGSNVFPEVSNLVKVTSIARAWGFCSGEKSQFPYVNSLTNITAGLINSWASCTNMQDSFPAVSNLVRTPSLYYAWDSATSCTSEFPFVNSLTNVNDLSYAWGSAYRMVFQFPEVSNLTNVTTVLGAWNSALSYTSYCPSVSGLTNLLSCSTAWKYNGKMIAPMPITNNNLLTKCTNYHDSFAYCTNLVGSIAHWTWMQTISDFDSYNSQIGYTNVPACFTNGVRLGGFTLNMSNSKMQQDNIDQILADFVTSGAGTNTLNLGGTDSVMSNQTPSTAGYVNVTNLRSRGWTVTVN